jgi:hypothetical protein
VAPRVYTSWAGSHFDGPFRAAAKHDMVWRRFLFSVTGNALMLGFQVGARRGCRSHPVLVLRSGAHGFWWRAGQGSRAVYGGWIRFELSGIGTLAVEALWRGRVKAMAISPSSSCPGRVRDPIFFSCELVGLL